MRKKKIKTWESNGWIFPRFYLKASVCRSMKLRKTQEGQRKSSLTTVVEMGNNHRGTKNLQDIQRKMTYYWAGQKVGLNFSVTLYGKTGKKFLTNPIYTREKVCKWWLTSNQKQYRSENKNYYCKVITTNTYQMNI